MEPSKRSQAVSDAIRIVFINSYNICNNPDRNRARYSRSPEFYRTRSPREIVACNGATLSSPFTSHDLRRTVATRLGESLGVGGEQLIKKVLGHSDGSVTAIYNRYGYVKEMRAGLEAWVRELMK